MPLPREALRRLAARGERPLVVFLDFDGTLSRVVPEPAAARLAPGLRPILARLARRVPTFVISGRRRADVRRRVGVREARYAGLHGLETGARDGILGVPTDETRAVRTLAQAWRRLARSVPGAHLEDKGLAATLHVRGVARPLQPALLRQARTAALPARAQALVRVRRGRESLEVLPKSARGKRGFVEDVLQQLYGLRWRGRVFPIYIGDDTTDRTAIRLVDRHGLALWVRSKETRPEPVPQLKGPLEVMEFLAWLERSLRTTFKAGRSSATSRPWTAKAPSAARPSRSKRPSSAPAPRAASSPKATGSWATTATAP